MPVDRLTETELDILCEVTNIGVGNAITSLAEMTNRKFLMSVPQVQSVELPDIPPMLGGGEPTVAVYMPVCGALHGHMALMFSWQSACVLWEMLVGSRPASYWHMSEMLSSAMLEMGNIVLCGFLNAMASLTSGPCHASPPYLAVDRPEVLLESIACQAWAERAEALALDADFRDDKHLARGFFLFIPAKGGLDAVFRVLGVQEGVA